MISLLDFTARAVVSVILGAVLGYEREKIGKSAGMRTYALVSLGSSIFTMASAHGFADTLGTDPSRVASQIVVGIGFIGAGIILHQRHKIKGLTTAAGMWVTAALGMIVGLGWYLPAIIVTIIMFFILYSSSKFRVKQKPFWKLWGKR